MKCYMSDTGSMHYTDTLQFIPATFKFPETTSEDYLCQSVVDILALLQYPPKTLPFHTYGDDTKNAITKIAHLLQRSVPQPRLTIIPLTPLVPLTKQLVSALPRLTPILPSPVDSLRVKSTVPAPRVQEYAPVRLTHPLSTRILRSNNRLINPRVLCPHHSGSYRAAVAQHLLMQHIFECPKAFKNTKYCTYTINLERRKLSTLLLMVPIVLPGGLHL